MKITIDNKCPSCGANVKFNPTTQKWDCEQCGNSYEIGQFEKQQEKETKENLDFEIDEYTCPNCGATVVTDANTVATHCVYCGNTTIMKNRLQGEFKPDKLIPFKTTKEEAIEDGCDILDGKSCCWNISDFTEYLQYYDNDYVVMIVKGSYVEDGHDEEPVVDISEIVEIWDYDEFVEVYQDYVERK